MNTNNNETAGAPVAPSLPERAVALRNAADAALHEAGVQLSALRALTAPFGRAAEFTGAFEVFMRLSFAELLTRDAESFLQEISPFYLAELVKKRGAL